MPKRKPGLQPAEDLLELPLPESAEAFVAQARAMRQRVAELEDKQGKLDARIDACNEEVRAVKKKHDLAGMQKLRREISSDIRRIAYGCLERADQMQLDFRKTA